MPTSRSRYGRRAVSSAALGLLLVGGATAPAFADSTRDEQWYLTVMKAESMWRTSKGEGVTVAVIDTGVDPNNADLQGRVLDGLNLAPKEAGDEHTDFGGHGTGMAGLIAATGAHGGGQGSFGLAPGAKILPIRMPDGAKLGNQYQSAEVFNRLAPKAIRYAVDHGAKVINISQGVLSGSDKLTGAVDYALKKGSLIFASSGNDGKGGNTVEYPAATPGVVGVGAVGKDLGVTAESTHGAQVDMAAPGDEMVHACGSKSSATGLCKSHGTSDATALASASAALIWAKHPNWTNNQVLRVMLNTIGGPTSGAKRSDFIGYGIVRPRIALKTPGDPGPADKYPLPDYPVAASKSPSAKPSKGAQAPGGTNSAAPAAVSKGDDSNTTLWIGIGVGALVVAGAATAVAVTRSRRRAAAQQASPPYPPAQPPYQGQPYGAPQFTNQQPYATPPSNGNQHSPHQGP
ncbi:MULTISPECIES: type VII secretion-associated serine protease mycosin [unclassified Streptomyces]|uniref:type VII secretion-associated serine protease mycosin n=1 Tax=unclassified Streptomyces TaxID=2593676 RepID=UPI002DDA4188|nr:type VII secretion-associated serine protease mycosin [Streptomyces sp. NBC_01445]WSE06922.1 type VII secretion-associated serine protease mycosin [Streptomyces sp. NBC_01445]